MNPAGARAVFTTDASLVVLSWDGWLPEATGIPAEAAVGRALGDLVPELAQRGLLTRLEVALEHGEPLVLSAALHGYLIPCVPRGRPGVFARMQQHVVVTPILGEGRVMGLTVTLEDVTARRERFRRAANTLEHGDEDDRLAALKQISSEDAEAPAFRAALGDPSWRVRAAARDALAQAGPDADATLLEVLRTGHRDPAALNAAIDALGRRGPEIVPRLAELLGDRSEEVRTYAALTLGLSGHAAAVPDLLQALGDPDVNVRYHAVEALGRLRALEAGPALLPLAEAGDGFLAFAALEAIAAIGDPSLAQGVARLLERPDLADAAARALGVLGSLEDALPLLELVRPGGAVVAAAEALCAIEARSGGVAPLLAEYAGEPEAGALIEALSRREAADVPELVRVLGWIRLPRVDERLVGALARPALAATAHTALVERGAGAVPALIAALRSDDDAQRAAAAQILGAMGSPDAVPALLELLAERDRSAVAAAAALKQIGDVRAFEPLIALLDADDVVLRHAAVGALNSIGQAELAARATELLAHPSQRVRESAARIVGYFGTGASDAFLALLDDEDESVRAAAAEHLGSLEGVGVAGRLEGALADPSEAVRCAAARALAQMDPAAAAAPLARALGDRRSWVRYHAARSAARQRNGAARGRLEALAESDAAPPVRIAALEALAEVGSERTAALARAALAEGDPDIVAAAVAGVDPRGPDGGAVLTEALRFPDARVRALAARRLARGGGEHVAALRAALAETDPEVERAVIGALAAVGTPEAIAAVLERLADRRSSGPAWAAVSDGSAASSEVLLEGLCCGDAAVRLRCVTLLADVPDARATAALVAALQDAVSAVRSAAQRALAARDVRAALAAPTPSSQRAPA